MKKILIILIACLSLFISCNQQDSTSFDRYFTDGTLRIDYFHTGDAVSETLEIDAVFQYEDWAGSRIHLEDPLNYGTYCYKIYDKSSGKLIYSRGFDSYFKEYQLTTPAIEGTVKQFHESAIIPFPESVIIFALDKRDKTGQLHEIFRTEIEPELIPEGPKDPDVRIYTSLDNGDPDVKMDIAIIGEGYTAEEEQKFRDDLERFTDLFFQTEPYTTHRNQFNFRGVLKPSSDSGIDEPRAGIDKQTAISATFNTMGSERYVLTEDNKSLRDIAGHVPYDALVIMVNHSRYGGGGIYNFYAVFTSDNLNSSYLFLHEFGHSFAGLADEYYTSSTAYNDFYPAGYEPAEPNITALPDPENLKWKHLLTPGIPIPTPWNKSEYDSLDLEWQSKRAGLNDHIASLKKNGAPEEEIEAAVEQYNSESSRRDKEMQAFLENSAYAGEVGAFEGAGYMSTGMYRPSINCIMFTRAGYFCPVCQEAIANVIALYTE
ncbi:MAG: peptidase M64 [Bacteroidales bacterium]|nr:peptidase M64 [Bacteroidales bacterium]MBN2699625.1 peptidase M64 [Bacteroidales bacterium]